MRWLLILLLAKTVFSHSQNADENLGIEDPNLTEGDMILTAKQRYEVEHGMDIDRKRGAGKFPQWPGGVVIYAIESRLAQYSPAMAAIRAGMNEWTTKTCIRFRRRSREASYVFFRSGRGCSSNVGRTGRAQYITLQQGCWSRGIVAHEIGHALGFFHEQSRPDRDTYVTIEIANILPSTLSNFRRYNAARINSLGLPYDYRSLMHYGSRAFTANGQITIRTKNPMYQNIIGQRGGLSALDAQQANLLYSSQCTSVPTQPPTPPPTPAPTRPPAPTALAPASCRDYFGSRYCIPRRRRCRSRWSGYFLRRVCKRTCNRC